MQQQLERPPSRATLPRRRRPRALLIVRRIHLYSGLLLLPAVLLYGVTAFLFNHPGALSETAVHHLDPEAARAAGISDPVSATRLADSVVSRLREEPALAEAALRIADPRRERNASLEVRTAEEIGRYTLAPSGAVRVSWRPRRDREAESPLDRRKFSVEETGLDALKDQVEALVRSEGREPERVRVRSYPIAFEMQHDDVTWAASYDVARESLSCHEKGTESSRSLRRQLLRLHVAHGFPADDLARTAWAVLVDVMAAAMVLWGLSGGIMWWQMKRTRRWGALTIVAGVALIGGAAIALAMA